MQAALWLLSSLAYQPLARPLVVPSSAVGGVAGRPQRHTTAVRLNAAAARDPSSVKAELLKVGLLSGRGVWARELERERAAELVAELERTAVETPSLADGTWELVMSDVSDQS